MDPTPIPSGAHRLYPELCFTPRGGREWIVEIVSFATADYLAHKRMRYRDAGIADVIVCLDRGVARGLDPDVDPDQRTLTFRRWIEASRVLEIATRPCS